MTEPRRIVITGATGLVGGHLVRLLSQRGDHVIAFSRNPRKARSIVPLAAEHVEWSASMTDGEWRQKVDGADAVINMAGRPLIARWTKKVKQQIYDSRVEGTQNLVRAMESARHKPSVFIGGSAVGYYGASTEGPVDEDSHPGNDYLARVCLDWERSALKAESLGTRVVVIRTGLVLDRNDGMLKILRPLFKLFVGGPVGTGKQPFPWIHWRDEVEIVLWALDNPQVSGPINAVSPGIVNNRQFSSALGAVLHRPSFIRVPAWAIRLVFADAADVFARGQHVLPGRARELGYRFKHPDLHAALRDVLGKDS